MFIIIYFVIFFSEFSSQRYAEGPVVNLEPEKHEGGVGLPQEVGQLHGKEEHTHRKAAHVGIQTK